MTINKTLIAGAGAVGLTVAETLYRHDRNCVSVLAKGERLERYRKNGLSVNGEVLNLRFSGGEEKADFIIAASKFHHLKELIEDMSPAVGKDTIILSLLNGISSEEIIGRRFGAERLPLAMIIGTDASYRDGNAAYSKKGVIHFGDAGGKNGAREECIAEFFTRSGVDFVLEENMKRAFWFKYMINVGSNQTTAVLRLPYGAMMKKGKEGEVPEARELAEKAMREVIACANAEGVDLGEDDIPRYYDSIGGLRPDGYTSMCQDVLAERKTEVEMFGLKIMELGKKHNIPVPVNEALYLLLRSIERTYSRPV